MFFKSLLSRSLPEKEEKIRTSRHVINCDALYWSVATAKSIENSHIALGYKEELQSGRLVEEHQEAYSTFFVVKTTPKRGTKVSYNTEAVAQYINRYSGFQVLLANSIKDPVETLQIYRDKDVVEKCFDDLKNQLDMKRLRMHTSQTVDGRLFVQFVALIYMSALRAEMRKSGLIERYTVREPLQEMETLTKVKYSGKYGYILTEVTKPQREILMGLNIEIPGKT
jgi:transposase